jgi:methionyl-tRNA formyltransferase
MNFAYLNLQDHPRGNIIMRHLVQNGFIPSIIIEEKSSLAVKNRNSLLSAFINYEEVIPSTKNIIADLNIPLVQVANHNDDECEKLLKNFDLDLVVLGDTRVIKKNIMNIPKLGIINSHPGYLPDVKGNNPYIWALIKDLPQGCSIHFIDETVDTGDILLRREIKLDGCRSYANLLNTINYLCADLMLEAVKQIKDYTFTRTPQIKLSFVKKDHVDCEFYAASKEIKEEAIRKLEKIIMHFSEPIIA